MGIAAIRRCTCVHPFQDRVYGKQMRVMNPMGKLGKITGYKCTVCTSVLQPEIWVAPKINLSKKDKKAEMKKVEPVSVIAHTSVSSTKNPKKEKKAPKQSPKTKKQKK